MILDFESFRDERAALRKLFPRTSLDLHRLRRIYSYTEEKWEEYAEKIPQRFVRYVLIAEAPPWSKECPPPFWLDPNSRVPLHALGRVFCQLRQAPYPDVLKVAAERGFLLLESIPFAMKYTSPQRLSQRYAALLKLTARSYLKAKINGSRLKWSQDLRIAFSLKRNAYAIIEATGGRLWFGDKRHTLSAKQIAVNGTGYPDCNELRRVFGIDCEK